MEVTLNDLLKMYEEVTLKRICIETPYYRANLEQTKKSWFCKRPNVPTEYLSTSVHNGFVSFREGFEAAGGVVHGEG